VTDVKQPHKFLSEAEGFFKIFDRSIADNDGAISDLAREARERLIAQLKRIIRTHPQHAKEALAILQRHGVVEEANAALDATGWKEAEGERTTSVEL
jgi:hypothetical protein